MKVANNIQAVQAKQFIHQREPVVNAMFCLYHISVSAVSPIGIISYNIQQTWANNILQLIIIFN